MKILNFGIQNNLRLFTSNLHPEQGDKATKSQGAAGSER